MSITLGGKKYTGADPYRKDDCHCFPEPMFAKEEQKQLRRYGLTKASDTPPECLRCGLPITRNTIIRALKNRGKSK